MFRLYFKLEYPVFQSFLENLSTFLVTFHQPDTHAYRFVDQLLKSNFLARIRELTKLRILMINFVLSRAFEKLFFFRFPVFYRCAFRCGRVENSARDFSRCQDP